MVGATFSATLEGILNLVFLVVQPACFCSRPPFNCDVIRNRGVGERAKPPKAPKKEIAQRKIYPYPPSISVCVLPPSVLGINSHCRVIAPDPCRVLAWLVPSPTSCARSRHGRQGNMILTRWGNALMSCKSLGMPKLGMNPCLWVTTGYSGSSQFRLHFFPRIN